MSLSGGAYLESVVLKDILNVLNRAVQILQTRSLLVLQLILELSGKLDIACKMGKKELLVLFSTPSGEKLSWKFFPRQLLPPNITGISHLQLV